MQRFVVYFTGKGLIYGLCSTDLRFDSETWAEVVVCAVDKSGLETGGKAKMYGCTYDWVGCNCFLCGTSYGSLGGLVSIPSASSKAARPVR